MDRDGGGRIPERDGQFLFAQESANISGKCFGIGNTFGEFDHFALAHRIDHRVAADSAGSTRMPGEKAGYTHQNRHSATIHKPRDLSDYSRIGLREYDDEGQPRRSWGVRWVGESTRKGMLCRAIKFVASYEAS